MEKINDKVDVVVFNKVNGKKYVAVLTSRKLNPDNIPPLCRLMFSQEAWLLRLSDIIFLLKD